MRLVNPTFGADGAALDQADAALEASDRQEIYLLSNAKPNATELLKGIGVYLHGFFGRAPVVVAKEDPSIGAPVDILNRIAREAKFAVVAIGD
jgi:thioredoxin reductase (NADPH)